MRLGKLAIAGVLGAGLAMASAAHAAVIDTFNVLSPGDSITAGDGSGTSATSSTFGLATSDVLGGTRTIGLELTSPLTDALLKLRVDTSGSPGAASLSSDDGASGKFTFHYGGALDADLLEGTNTAIALVFLAADHTATLSVKLTDQDSDSTVTMPETTGAHVTLVPFASFAGIDFQHIKTVDIVIDGQDSYDARIDSISTVPTPAAVWAGLSLLGGLAVRRLRRA